VKYISEEEILKRLEELGKKIAKQILKGEKPKLEIPLRTLSNTIWDEERGLLLLGPKRAVREFFDLKEAKKFMQTVLMLSLLVRARREGDYPTIRDLYYTGKHTIVYIDHLGRTAREETWDDQRESNSVLQDIEVMTGLLREHMGVMHDAKGKIVGNIVIRSKGYEIDCSRMGSGAYAIPPNPDRLEILRVNAEYVLVVEKDAIFERLNEEEYWRKENCILITGKGQPDRSTRRMVRRLWEEYDLPVYILTDADSIPPWELIIARDSRTGEVKMGTIGELLRPYIDPSREKELIYVPWEVPSMSESGKVKWSKVEYAYRHRIKGKLLKIYTRDRGIIEVTPSHSLFAFKEGGIKAVKASELRIGDHLIICSKLPMWRGAGTYDTKRLTNGALLGERLAWLLGLWCIRGEIGIDELIFKLPREKGYLIDEVRDALLTELGLKDVTLNCSEGGDIVLKIRGHTLARIFTRLINPEGGILPPLLNSPKEVIRSFVKGVIDGGKLITDSEVKFKIRKRALAKQLALLFLSLGPKVNVKEVEGGSVIKVKFNSLVNDGGREPYTSLTIGRFTNEGSIALTEVERIEEYEYEGDVYDLAVPNTNSFVGGYGVVYHNSYGFYIYSVYKSGSIALSYESERLATPGARFIGLTVSDIDEYKIPKNYIIKATEMDLKRAKELMRYPWFKSKAWQRELKLFLDKGEKVEIEALSGHGFKFLSHNYLPEKIKKGLWIE